MDITREDAISIMNVIVHMLEPQYDTDRVEDAVAMATEALEQPEIIRCKDCDEWQRGKSSLSGARCCSDEGLCCNWRVLTGENFYCGDARKRINKLTETLNQRKEGHWIGIDEEPHEDYECDKCGYVVSTFTANIEPHTEYKYCPNCGAKMKRGE